MPLLKYHRKLFVFGLVILAINVILMAVSLANGNQHEAAFNGVVVLVCLAGTYFNWRNRSRYDTMVDEMNAERRNQLIRLTIGE